MPHNPSRVNDGEERPAVGTLFLITGTALFTVSVLAGKDWMMAVTSLVIGVQIERSGPPGGVINITLGLLLLLVVWNRRRKRKGTVAVGAKSRALRDALVRRMRDRVILIPA
jgi:hypothetical protein